MTYATYRNCLASLVVTAVIIAASAGAARAQGAVLSDDDDDDVSEPEVSAVNAEDPNRARYGVGVRLRNIRLPESIIELFVEDAAGGGSNFGFGIELIRRKANFELALGIEYDSLNATDGIWVDKGDELPQDEPDRLKFDGFGWIAADISFIWQQALHKMFAIRYGAGLGLGVITGKLERFDSSCTSSDTTSCSDIGTPPTENAGIPPVFPIVNLILGVQVRPTENLFINLETGIRTVPFLGATVGYIF
jgi:hypothetical protein